MTLATLRGRIASVLVSAAVYAAAQEATPPATASGGWLNAADFGASGSPAEAVAAIVAGSKEITVAALGDFRAGQGVTVSRASPRFLAPLIWGPTEPYSSCKPLGDALEMRGYDGSTSTWLVYLLEVDGAEPLSFRWSDALVHQGQWQGTKVAITWDWQALSHGIEVKFNRRDLAPGHMLTFSARDQLETVIEKVDGTTLTLRDPVQRSVGDAVLRHDDTRALQAAIDAAIRAKRNVHFPAGWYRLSRGLQVRTEAICLEGANGVDTVLDIANGQGAVFQVSDCLNVTLRNFRMLGHTGLNDAAGEFTTSSGFGFWACALRGCNAVSMERNENLWIENVHVSRMASEAFYASGTMRESQKEQARYQKSLVYLRCSVSDCAANAFNNNDVGENTSVLYCRIDGAGWHAAEMPARFLKLVGNYVRNAGAFTIGDMSHRYSDLHQLGCGQAVVTDNVFEGIGRSGGIVVNHGASQVVIANNLFINFNGNAITASSQTVRTSFPSSTVTITGNLIDMTYAGERPAARTGITVSTANTIVANNQVYVRGKVDPRVTGLVIAEPALNLLVHDNLVRNCQQGIVTRRVGSRITAVLDATTFLEQGLPLEWRDSHLYRGWNVVWTGGQAGGSSVIAAFDPESLRFRLKEPREMKVGDAFQVFPPGPANWTLHSNTVTGCAEPVRLEAYGSENSVFRDNTVSRGEATGVYAAIRVAGQFRLIGNLVSGFDEADSAALAIGPDAGGRFARNLYLRNTFERCAAVVQEAREGLWQESVADGNLFVDCQTAPATGGTVVRREQLEPLLLPPPPKPQLRAAACSAPVAVDGAVGEWPWQDAARVIALAQTPAGDAIQTPLGQACAAWDATNLYLAIRLVLPTGAAAVGGANWGVGDGVEVSFQHAAAAAAAPIFLVWGDAAGRFQSGTYGGATTAQVQALEKALVYAVRSAPGEWTCEWQIPFAAAGLAAAAVKELRFNLGVHQAASDAWGAWIATGGALYQVGSAGTLSLEP